MLRETEPLRNVRLIPRKVYSVNASETSDEIKGQVQQIAMNDGYNSDWMAQHFWVLVSA